MTALAANLTPLAWAQGWVKESRRAAAGTYATGKRGFFGSMNISVNGVAQPLVSGTALVALATTFAGADANGGVVMRAKRANVAVQFAAGNSKTLSVTSITYGATIAILIQQGTDGGGATTNTAEQMCNLIRGNGELNKLLACKATGDGSGLTATTAGTAIKFIEMLGVTERDIDNSAGGSPLALTEFDCFHVGLYGLTPDAAAVPVLNTIGYLADDQTVTATADPLSFTAPVLQTDPRGFMFVDLSEAR